MTKVVVKCDKNWILERMDCWEYRNTNRYRNYIAIVTKNDSGELDCNWLKKGNITDELYNITNVKVGDILMAGYKDCYKSSKSYKRFFKVIDRTENELVLLEETTYRKALNAENMEEE